MKEYHRGSILECTSDESIESESFATLELQINDWKLWPEQFCRA
jgi:hypothetical protein